MKIFKSTKRKLKKILGGIVLFVFTANVTLVGAMGLPDEPKDVHIALPGNVVINEINWAGSTASAADEWIELRNTTASDIDLSDWTIEGAAASDGNLTISSGVVSANGYFLISNYNKAASRLDVVPDLVTSSISLANSGAQYTLKDSEDSVIDIADDGVGAPLAGDNTNKYSMERNITITDGILASSWHTATTSVDFDEDETDRGTPKSVNASIPPVAPSASLMTLTQNDPGINDTLQGSQGSVGNGTIVKVYKDSALVSLIGFIQANPDGSFDVFNIGDNKADENNKIYVISEDLAGNTSDYTIMTNDSLGPEINIALSSEYISLDNPTVTISYDLSETADVEMNIYPAGSDDLLKNFSDSGVTEGDETWDGTREGETEILDSGVYNVEIQATDELGNVSFKIAQIQIDMEAPNATFDSFVNTSNPTNNNNPEVMGKYSITSDIEKVVVVFDKDGQKYEKETVLDEDNGAYFTQKKDVFITTILEEGKEAVSSLAVLPDGTYKVSAISYDAAGNSAIEDIEDADALVVDTVAPSVPTGLKTVSKTPSSISVSWTANTEEDLLGYRVYWGTKEGEYKNIADVGMSTSYILKGLSSSTAYYFKVLAYDKASNESSLSNSLDEKTSAIVSSIEFTDPDAQGDTKSSPKEENKGVVESAQAASPENANKDEQKNDPSKNEQSAQTKGRNSLFLLSILLMVFGVSGYYYYSLNPGKFKNFKFPKLPGIK